MSRKMADASLLNMPGVPAAPKSPFSAGAGAAALKPVTQAAAAAPPKLPVPKVPVAPMTRTESPARQTELHRGVGDDSSYLAYQNAIRNTKLPGVGGGYGAAVDLKSPAVSKYWADQQAELRRQWDQSDTPPAQLLNKFNPEAIGSRYIADNVANYQQETHEDTYGKGMQGAYQRALGFRRLNPATGKYEITADGNIGQDPNGTASAIATSAAGVPLTAAAALTLPVQAAVGNYSPIQGAVRSLMAGPNHLKGMDLGHSLGVDAKLDTPWTVPQDQQHLFTNAAAKTTPNLVGSDVYDPLTGTYKPSQAAAAAGQAKTVAADPNNGASPVSRSLANMTAGALENARDIYGGAMVGSGMSRAIAPLSTIGRGSVALGALNLADNTKGETVTDRILPAVSHAFNGAMSPLAANPMYTGTTEVLNRTGVQDKFNAAGNYIRDNGGDETSPKWQRAISNTLAGGLESLPQAASSLLSPSTMLQRLPAKQYIANVLKRTGNNAAYLGAAGGLGEGLAAAATPTPTTPDELAQAAAQGEYRRLPVAEQRAKQLEQFYATADEFNQKHNPETPDPAAAAKQPEFDYSTVLPNYGKAKQYAEQQPEMSAKMLETANKTVTTAASTSEGKQVLAHVQETGELPPKADEVAKYNLINDGFDSEKIGEWYGNLGGAEKFALWGGVSMTVLGLMHAMNGGGVGGMLAALLGLGTAGLTAGQSGLFGDAAQEQSQKITQPIGNAVTGGLTAVAGKALSNPSILKMVAPHLDSLPDGIRDSALQKMQDHMRQSKDPEMLKKVEGLNAVHGQGWKGILNNAASSFGADNIAKQQAIQQLTEAGFTPATANRFVDLWAKQQ